MSFAHVQDVILSYCQRSVPRETNADEYEYGIFLQKSFAHVQDVIPCSGVLPYQGLKVGYCTDIKENMYKCSPPLQINPLSASPSDQAAQPLSQCSHKKLHSACSFPLLMMEPEVDKDNNHLIRFADFPDNRVWTTKGMVPKEVNDAICIGSSHGWLAYISRRDCSIFLWNPFITITSPDPPRLIRLPPIDTLPHVTVVPLGESGILRKSDDWHCTSTTSNILRSAYEDKFSADC